MILGKEIIRKENSLTRILQILIHFDQVYHASTYFGSSNV